MSKILSSIESREKSLHNIEVGDLMGEQNRTSHTFV